MTPKQLYIEYRSRGRKVPNFVKEYMETGGFDASFLSSKDLEDLELFGNFNEFNEGGSHESNPAGGVHIGPTARVEEGETSIDINDGKFIFSDRITTAGDFLKSVPKDK